MDAVQPLRISKNNTPASSPVKIAGSATSRPLAEIGSTERRRNSPSYNQATKKMIVTREASPYTENSSPTSFTKPSPRDFWTGRDAMSPTRFDNENSPAPDSSPSLSSPKRRPSVERLMQASRVRNSNIFALESKDAYDPSTLPIVERPIANRPLSQSVANNSFARFDSFKKENNPFRSPNKSGHKRSESQTQLPILTPSKIPLPGSPTKDSRGSPSPTKSSLARSSQFGTSAQANFSDDAGDGDRAPTPRALHRNTKSVTFHHDPPVVNEYEEQTPEPSVSVTSDREGSWDSEDFDEQDISFDRGSSADPERYDDSFDADLENADKTPVVLPEDWSRMSPEAARTDLVDAADDVFDNDGESTQRGLQVTPAKVNDRVASDGEARPLPPLPAFMQRGRSGSDSLTSAAERAAQATRNILSPPKRAACSKDEILQMIGKSPLSSPKRTDDAEEEPFTVTNLDTGEKREVHVTETEAEEDSIVADLAEFAKAPPRISRESILRKVRNSKYDFEDFEGEDEGDESELHSNGVPTTRPSMLNPDQPIPSIETGRDTSSTYSDSVVVSGHRQLEPEPQIKPEPADEDGFDMESIPATTEGARSPSRLDDYDRQSSVLHHGRPSLSEDEDENDTASRYSSVGAPDAENGQGTTRQDTLEKEDGKESLQEAMQLLTVKDYSGRSATKQGSLSGEFVGLPAYLSTGDFDFGMKEFITPSPPAEVSKAALPKLQDTMPRLQPPVELNPTPNTKTWQPPTQREVSPPGTPDSVIHHDDGIVSPIVDYSEFIDEQLSAELPEVPERVSSIKTPGGKLKARPSATPADLASMAEQRRILSGEYPVPPIPAVYQAEGSLQPAAAEEDARDLEENGEDADHEQVKPRKTDKRKSRKSGGRMDFSFLDTSSLSIAAEDDGLGLDEDFDRITEAQKKGYLMRQNTKVVVATTRNFSGDSNDTAKSGSTIRGDEATTAGTDTSRPTSKSAKKDNASPRKASEEQFLKTEPWNGKVRRKSIRNASALKAARTEVAPPLPGQESALGIVDEDTAFGLDDDVGEGVERGRLFVKVVGVKELDLPLPRNDRVYFQLTLDNGLHCVTTTSLELGMNAPIGQEFELVVLNDLEFQLTLTTKLPPRSQPTPPSSSGSPTKSSPVKAQKASGFSRFLSSPKKRAEKERQEREAAEAEGRRMEEEAQKKRVSQAPSAWDQLHDLVNETDGSFARAYVNLKTHEQQCFGRQLTVNVPCYNEWALENDAQVVHSIRSKRGTLTGPIKRPPYVIGQMQLQLLYVPKPKGAVEEDMPKSMSAAVREMKKAGEASDASHEGHLSQQGGDCIHWRRRFFRLQGTKLTAYHEHTHQKRAVINLSKASRLVDGKRMLVADPSPAKSGKGRRKSAFAEEDEAYQYVEEGFRMRFANGETIDFYADSRELKEQWMIVLSKVIGKPDAATKPATWTDVVLARERTANASGGVSSPVKDKDSVPEVKDFGRTAPPQPPLPALPLTAPAVPSTKSAPSSPSKGAAPPVRSAPAPPAATPATRPATPPMSPRRAGKSRDAVKSMIF